MQKIIIPTTFGSFVIELSEPDSEGRKSGVINNEFTLTEECEKEVNTLETFILALACEGVDVESEAFLSALNTTLDAIDNY